MNESKKAILVVSFGTSHADTRKVTIDATENLFKSHFKDYDVYRAFTSNAVIKILNQRDGIHVNHPKAALEQLKTEGYQTVIVQSLHIMNGSEFHYLAKIVTDYKTAFTHIAIGTALLSDHDDYLKTINAILPTFPPLSDESALVMMGHGSHHPANAIYPTLEHVCHSLGHEHVYIGTVEGYPTLSDVLIRLRCKSYKRITLMPLMIVAGDHAKNDMAGDSETSWLNVLKRAGFQVEVYNHGIGELRDIQAIFLAHTQNAIDGKAYQHPKHNL